MKQILTFFLLACPVLITAQGPIDHVDPLIGTAPAATESAKRHGAGTEDKGQTFPGVGRPFGMTQWTPETRTTEIKCVSPYYYNDRFITGFRGSHWMSGSCTQDYGSITIMPFATSAPDTLTRPPVSVFTHDREMAAPNVYWLEMETYPVTAELTASARSGMMRFTFSGNDDGYLLIRVNSDEKEGRITINREKNEIIAYNPVHRIYQGWGKPAGFAGHFVIQTDVPFTETDILRSKQQVIIRTGSARIIHVKAGGSFTGEAGARNNLVAEIPGWDFHRVMTEGADEWNRSLGRIEVKSNNDDDLKKFYTALYHCFQLPRTASDVDGSYPGFAEDSLVHNTGGFVYYDDFSMWDTYRALHPLLAIIEPERTRDMIRSLILKAEQGGWMPIFPAWSNYTAAMIGDHASTMIADAYIKGIGDFDTDKAFSFMKQNAFGTPSRNEYVDGKGRRALESYMKYGYIPLEDSVWDAFHKNEQVSRTLEYALDDYALARYARKAGYDEDYKVLMKRSENWKNVFDRGAGYVRGRYADGRWIEPFDPYSKAKFICEGTPFHYTWYVPHDANGLFKMMGGRKNALSKLNTFFDEGHYWHGNEPGHQIPFMFAMAGDRAGTARWTEEIINVEYGTGPGGLSGNEDAGQMSAWLVFAMSGLYPVCPASGEYVITTPWFSEVTINNPGGNKFTLRWGGEQKPQAQNTVVYMNGKRLNKSVIMHEDIISGNTLEFSSKGTR